MTSIKESGTDADLFVLLVDGGYDERLFSSDVFTTVPVLDVPMEHFKRMAFIYTVIELNTAVKPFFIDYLWNKGYREVIYLDPDIYCYRSLNPIFDKLSQFDAAVTPHITSPLNDGLRPDDLAILRAGVYNLGFLALARSAETEAFLDWWQDKLISMCRVDLPNGLFVDQIWCNFLPCFVHKSHIERNPGWNVAYWNLIHRTVVESATGYYVNGEPLIFFHFSGVVPTETIVFSKHENRFQKKGLPKTVQKIVEDYVERIMNDGVQQYSQHDYYFNYFSGIEQQISPPVRQLYLTDSSIQAIFGDDPFDVSRDPEFANSYNYPAFDNGQPVTKLMRYIHSIRRDLQGAFPDVEGADSEALARWFLSATNREYGFGEIFTEPVAKMLSERVATTAKNVSQVVREMPSRFIQSVSNAASPETEGKTNASQNGFSAAIRLRVWAKLAAMIHRIIKQTIPSHEKKENIKVWALKLAYKRRRSDISRFKSRFFNGGINLIGYLRGELGVGEAARSTIAAAKAVGLDVSAIDFREGCLARMQHAIEGVRNQGPKFLTSIFHINADQVAIVTSYFGPGFLREHFNIGFWFWEMPIFPDKWMDSFLPFQEIWVASTFCLDAIGRKAPIPVCRIPLCIQPQVPSIIDRSTLGLPEEKFLFLAMGDFLSVPERKNLLGAVKAFRRAFGTNSSESCLVLKVLNPNSRPDMMTKIEDISAGDLSIILIDDYKSRTQLNGLINACDCLVSLHRSEGFGLPIAEAMNMGKPVIATGWSANMDFMNLSNSFPIKYKIVQLEANYGPYEKGNFWADPDLDHAAEMMRLVCFQPDLGKERGEQAAKTIRRELSPEAVGRIIKERLNTIGNFHNRMENLRI